MAVITITKDNFENEVLGAKLPVVLDFWAEWCAPCKMQSPVIEALAEELDGKVIFGKVNVDEEAALALKYQIMSIPTLVVMKYGLFQNRAVGLQTREEIMDMIAQIKEDERLFASGIPMRNPLVYECCHYQGIHKLKNEFCFRTYALFFW